jgi:hypothetical protein
VFTIEFLAKMRQPSFPPVHRRWPHHKHDWCDLARLQAPPGKTMVRTSTVQQELCKPHQTLYHWKDM